MEAEEPIVHLKLFKNSSFAVSNLLMLLGAVLFGSTVLIPQFVQVEMGYTAEKAGEVLSPGGFFILLLMPIVGFLVSRVDARYLIAFGFIISAAALFHMTNLNLNLDFGTFMWWRVYQAAGLAFLFVPINTISYTGTAREDSNQVSGMVNLMRNMGGSIGISAVTTLIIRRSQVHQNYLARNTFQYNPHFQQLLTGVTARFQTRTGSVEATRQAYGRIYGLVQRQASVLAYIDAFWIMGTLCVLAMGLLFCKKNKPGSAPAAH